MGFEFRSDQPEQSMPAVTTTTLSVNEPLGRTPKNRNVESKITEEENLTQIVYSEGEEGQLAIQFIEENELYTKFLLWQGIQEQLKKAEDNLDS
jgi:hypothetical protein